ncbi:hypothetical protein D3C81_2008880 [compost metagenome]
MTQRKIHRIDAPMVGIEVDHAMGLTHFGVPGSVQFTFQRADKRREHVQNQRPALLQNPAEAGIHAGTDDDRPHLITLPGRPDTRRRLLGFVGIVHE